MLINMVQNVVHHYDFRKIKNGWNLLDPYGWIQWYFSYWLGGRSLHDKRQVNGWKKIVVDLKRN